MSSIDLGGNSLLNGYWSGTPAQKGTTGEVWIAVRTDGIAGTGTPEDPFDGSSQTKFDALMRGFGTYTAIHLAPGVYLTRGWDDGMGTAGFVLLEGQRLMGAGRGATIVRLAAINPASSRMIVVANATNADADYAYVGDLTIDCNYPNLTVPSGFVLDAGRLSGNHVIFQRVECINSFGSSVSSNEGFTLVAGTRGGPGGSSVVGILIDACNVRLTHGDYTNGIIVGKGYPDPVTISGVIRNCTVENNIWTAFSCGGVDGLLVTGNKCLNCGVGFYFDTGDVNAVRVVDNDLRATIPVHFYAQGASGSFGNVLVADNYAESNDSSGSACGILVQGDNAGIYSNLRIVDNLVNMTANAGYAVSVDTAYWQRVWVDGNVSNRGLNTTGTGPDATFQQGVNYWSAYSPEYAGQFKNLLIGGDFSTNPWQRGTTFGPPCVSGAYTADRWVSYINGATAPSTITRQTGIGLAGFNAGLRAQRVNGNTGTGPLGIWQTIESVNIIPLQGKTVVLSFWARAGADFSAAGAALTAGFGTGMVADEGTFSGIAGMWTGAVYSTPTQALTTTWGRYSFAFPVGTNVQEAAAYLFYVPTGTAGANDYFEVAGVQVEGATAATLFERRAPPQEQLLCGRYYQQHPAVVETAAAYQAWSLPVAMRLNPAITGGGAGFTVATADPQMVLVHQTARGVQTLAFDAEL